MSEHLVCLGCGGVVVEDDEVADPSSLCTCPPAAGSAYRTVSCPKCGGPIEPGARACRFCRSTVASRRCWDCTAWNLVDAVHCQACGSPLSQMEGGKDTALPCPRCETMLMMHTYRDLNADECDTCGGLFLNAESMERIVTSRDAPTGLRLALPQRDREREPNIRYLACPRCSNLMNRKNFGRFSGVIVDVCRGHGVWFDAGELSAMLSFIEKGGLERTRERELAELRDAKREQVVASTPGPVIARALNQRSSDEHQPYRGEVLAEGIATGAAEVLYALIKLWV